MFRRVVIPQDGPALRGAVCVKTPVFSNVYSNPRPLLNIDRSLVHIDRFLPEMAIHRPLLNIDKSLLNIDQFLLNIDRGGGGNFISTS